MKDFEKCLLVSVCAVFIVSVFITLISYAKLDERINKLEETVSSHSEMWADQLEVDEAFMDIIESIF